MRPPAKGLIKKNTKKLHMIGMGYVTFLRPNFRIIGSVSFLAGEWKTTKFVLLMLRANLLASSHFLHDEVPCSLFFAEFSNP